MSSRAAGLLADLIRCASVTPVEAGVLDAIAAALTPLGFEVTRHRFEGDGSYPVDNLFATRKRGGRHLLFAGHTDVVPPGDAAQWTHDPFDPREADGMVYGRGAVDMKGAIAAFIAAVETLVHSGEADKGTISLAITNDEEADAVNGTDKLLKAVAAEGARFDFAIVGEPSSRVRLGDSLKVGRRGSLNGRIVVTGVQGHVAYPERATNPLPGMARLAAHLGGLVLDAGSANFPASNLELTSLDVGNETTNVIPAKGVLRFNVRFNDQWTPETLTMKIESELARVDLGGAIATLEIVGRPSRSFLSAGSPDVALLDAVIKTQTGMVPEHSTGGGTSDARFVAAYCPVVELGLVGETMHKIDERVPVADLEALTALYAGFAARFFSQEAAQ